MWFVVLFRWAMFLLTLKEFSSLMICWMYVFELLRFAWFVNEGSALSRHVFVYRAACRIRSINPVALGFSETSSSEFSVAIKF